jgi:hypothetical protein
MTKPVVCLVTPADPNDQTRKSRDAFEHELGNSGWSRPSIEFHAYYGYYDKKILKAVADKAVKKAEAAMKAGQPAAIVAAGVVATTILQGMTKSVPIIQAVGGSKPSTRAKNVTGFYFDAIQTSKDQLDKLSGNDEVTVLYDSTNTPSNAAWKALKSYAKQTYPKLKVTPRDVQDLGKLKSSHINGSFMLIPNTMFYNRCNEITDLVHESKVPAIYPEREYKMAHKKTAGIAVHGHHVPLTYRLAANYVNSILAGALTVKNLPEFKEAVTDKHELDQTVALKGPSQSKSTKRKK